MITGSIVALITPMNHEGSVDFANLEKLVEWHVEQGTDAIVAMGTTGESTTLSMAEHIEVVAQTVKFAANRIPIIGGNGANATAEAVELTKALAKVGVAAMLGVTPYYNRPTPKGIIAHYQAVAASTDIPQILYNVPSRTALDMQAETVAELATVPNIIGLKDATGDLSRVGRLRQLCGDEFLLFSGDDATARSFLLQGGNGVISVANNIAPKAFKAMCDAAMAKNIALADQLDAPLIELYSTLFCEANPIPVKWAMQRMGLINCGHLRLPLTELSVSCQSSLLAAMRHAQLEVNEC